MQKTIRSIEEIRVINERLVRLYGRNVSTNQSNFSVVWSDDEREVRHGDFDCIVNDRYLRTEKNVTREVEKYPFFPEMWVLQRLVPNMLPEVITETGWTYEPLYPFDILPSWAAVEHCIHSLTTTKEKFKREAPHNQEQCNIAEKKHLAKEKAKVWNMLDNTAIESALHDGGAVSYVGINGRPSEQEVEK